MPEHTFPPYWNYHADAPGGGNARWSGYWPRMIDAVAGEMGFSYDLVAEPSMLHARSQTDVYNSILSSGIDVAFVDLADSATFTPWFEANMAHSMPVFEDFYGAVVLRTRTSPGYWQLTQPMAKDLWAALFITLLIGAVLMNVIGSISPPDSANTRCERFTIDGSAKSVYNMLSTVLGGEDYEWVTWSGRILRLGILFFTLIVTATYTANLAAFFTNPNYLIHGPKDLAELRTSTVCVRTPLYNRVLPFVGKLVYATEDLTVTDMELLEKRCKQKLQSGEADAWMDSLVALTSFILDSKNCADFHLVSNIKVLPIQSGFLLNKADAEFAGNMSAALVHFKQLPEFLALQQSEFGLGRSLACKQTPAAVAQSLSLHLSSMWGLFIITGAFFFISLVVAAGSAAQNRWQQIRRKDVEPDDADAVIPHAPTHAGAYHHSMTEGEMLRMLLQKVDGLWAMAEGKLTHPKDDQSNPDPSSSFTDYPPAEL